MNIPKRKSTYFSEPFKRIEGSITAFTKNIKNWDLLESNLQAIDCIIENSLKIHRHNQDGMAIQKIFQPLLSGESIIYAISRHFTAPNHTNKNTSSRRYIFVIEMYHYNSSTCQKIKAYVNEEEAEDHLKSELKKTTHAASRVIIENKDHLGEVTRTESFYANNSPGLCLMARDLFKFCSDHSAFFKAKNILSLNAIEKVCSAFTPNSTALHLAAEFGITPIIHQYKARYGHLNPRDTEGTTPLHTAAYHAKLNFAIKLIEEGADPHSENNYGEKIHDIVYNKKGSASSDPERFLSAIENCAVMKKSQDTTDTDSGEEDSFSL